MSKGVTHYMQRVDMEGQAAIDIEETYKGLLYSKCEGLDAKGERLNVYTEEFAESDELRVWQGADVARKPTTLTFTFFFTGDERQATMDSFYEYIKNGRFYYWDTKRLKKGYFIVKDEFKANEDVYQGSIPYKKIELKVQNLWGECKNCDKDGNLI